MNSSQLVEAVLGLGLGLLSTVAAAQMLPSDPPNMTATEVTRFRNYLAEPKYRSALLAAARRHNDSLPSSCPDAEFTLLPAVSFPQQVHFDTTGNPTQGAWVLHFETSGCATKLRLNILTIVRPPQDPNVVALLPGTSRADPFLQRDALLYAYQGTVSLRPKNCANAQIIETTFVAFEGTPLPEVKPGRDPRPWVESWTVDSCGVLIAVPMHFVPDATGTAIWSTPNEAKLK